MRDFKGYILQNLLTSVQSTKNSGGFTVYTWVHDIKFWTKYSH